MRASLFITALLLKVALWSSCEVAEAGEHAHAVVPRIVKVFDFDERPLGNFDTTPMNWRRIVEPGYPRFLEARFDESVGHDAPPSLHLPMQNGNLGLRYLGADIPAEEDGSYRITAWVKVRGLRHGSAWMSASYLGQNMKPMPGTERRSDSVRGASDDAWHRLTIDMPSGVRHVRWISLAFRVEQSERVAADDTAVFPVEYRDVRGEAWIDDIAVIRMPRVSLHLDAPEGIYEGKRAPIVTVDVRDAAGEDLMAELRVFDADGREADCVRSWRVGDENRAVSSALPELPPGYYVVAVRVTASDRELYREDRAFVRLAPIPCEKGPTGIAITLDPMAEECAEQTARMIRALKPDAVKLPIWRSEMSDKEIVAGSPAFTRFINLLRAEGSTLVGVIDSPPHSLANQYPKARRGLYDVLASDRAKWAPYLSLAVTRYALWIDYWQIGGDQLDRLVTPQNRKEAVAQVEAEIRPLIGPSRIVIPASPQEPMVDEAGDLDIVACPPDRSAAECLESLSASPGARPRWAAIEPLDALRYERIARISDFARSLIAGRIHGVEKIFVPAPWSRSDVDGAILQPTEEVIIMRTLARLLAGHSPIAPIRMGRGITAYLFSEGGSSHGIVAAWTDGSSPRRRPVAFDFGREVAAYDVWGNKKIAPHDPLMGNLIQVGAMPTLLIVPDAERARLAAALVCEPDVLTPTIHPQDISVALTNPSTEPVRGMLRLAGPRGWRIMPATVPVTIEPGATLKIPVAVCLPSNQSVGAFSLAATLRMSAESGDQIVMQAPMEVRSSALDIDVAAYVEADNLRIVQRVINRTDGAIDLRSSLIAPGMAPQFRTIRHLDPGASAIRRYSLDAVAPPSAVRISTEQVGGPVRHNVLVDLKNPK